MLTRVPRIAPSEITPPEIYFNRRTFLAGAVASAASASLRAGDAAPPSESALTYRRNPQYSVSEPPNRLEEIAGYNNFYEFGTDKESPGRYAHTLRTRPWRDRKSTRLNSSHMSISYAVFCLKKKKKINKPYL